MKRDTGTPSRQQKNFSHYFTDHIYVPIELNFVKNVADLKFNNGATSKASHIGTVLLRSQI